MADYLTDLAARLAPALVGQTIADHASTHEDGGDDEVAAENLPTALTAGQVLVGGGSGDLVAGDAEDIATALTAGQVLVADGAGALAAGVAEDIGTAIGAGSVLVGDGAGALVEGNVEDIATALTAGQCPTSDGAGALVAGLAIREYVSAQVVFTGRTGASEDVALSPAFPDNVIVLCAALEIDTQPAGEADFAGQIGDAADPDGLTASIVLDAVAAGWAPTVAGAESGARFEADYTPRLRLTATDLADVSAGAGKVHIWYATPSLSE